MLYAAVVIPIVVPATHPDDATIVFVRRAAHLRRNPGQIAFPGGLVDATDADERAAAAREFEEELGIPRARIRIVDRFADVTTLARSVSIAPFLGFLAAPARFAVDERETAGVYEVPLGALYARDALHRGVEALIVDGRSVEVPSWLFDHHELHVWGATARILAALVARYPTVETVLATG
ncbi:MAG: NUDIX domain-containing protein [Candidatus Eremiobacteraeota bacterium]|nr:NUDIX domain-containing protein [Candidatus Eremiobacteraeota bacterium]